MPAVFYLVRAPAALRQFNFQAEYRWRGGLTGTVHSLRTLWAIHAQ